MAICKQCGRGFANEAKFCTYCGARNEQFGSAAIEPDVTEQTAQPAQPKSAEPIFAPIAPQGAYQTGAATPPQGTAYQTGAAIPPQGAYQNSSYSAATTINVGQEKPKEQVSTTGIMVWSVITLLCCNVGAILGVIAVIFSLIAGVEKDYNSDKAKKYLYYAKVCNIVGLILGIIIAILYGALIAQYVSIFTALIEQGGGAGA
ncbi:MAG: hypothetical protein LBP62_00790 [Clostridiales bacterium]|jgi:hypothetical protein|nr:hypothetical protein [Clostridiales bacterium]